LEEEGGDKLARHRRRMFKKHEDQLLLTFGAGAKPVGKNCL
jgi:hypothetical protein